MGLLLLLILAINCTAGDFPDRIDSVKSFNCKVVRMGDYWRIGALVEYADGTHWGRVIGMYRERAKALKETDRWMECMDRRVKLASVAPHGSYVCAVAHGEDR